MANIHPFRAWRYTARAGPLDQLATQPYDTIPSDLERAYRASGPNNLVWLILPGGDYAGAAARLDTWIADGILAQDDSAALYVYEQRFRLPDSGETLVRRSLIGLGDLEPYGRVVHRHELTLDAPVADRLALLQHTRAQFGSIFLMYPDAEGRVDRLLGEAADDEPAARFLDHQETAHVLWRIADPRWIEAAQRAMCKMPLVIVDGHHRYEAALRYGREPRVMMALVNLYSPGLRTLAAHRVVSGLPAFPREKLLHMSAPVDDLRTAWNATPPGRVRFGMALVDGLRLMELENPEGALNLSVLHERVLHAMLGITPEAVARRRFVAPCRGIDAAMAQVASGAAQAAFLVEPLDVREVARMALSGRTLPQKSTDFYPKLTSGVTIYRFNP
jgi:uncharacterized protein (DUF1015 family)